MIGKQIRMSRVLDPASDSALIVAYSHGILFGPSEGLYSTDEFRSNVSLFAEAGATGMMLTPGYLRVCADLLLGPGKPAPIFSLSWSNIWRGPDMLGHDGFQNAHTLIASVEDAVRAGADMVHLYVHGGSTDSQQDAAEMKRLGEVVSESERYGIPVLCEPLARGTAVAPGTSNRTEYVALMARMAAEAGADMVKVEYTGDAESFAEVVQTCAVPVVMMGGAKSDRFIDFLTLLEDGMKAGARGVAVGRNLFLHSNPEQATIAVRRVVRERVSARVAAEEMELAINEAVII
jgi:DhnA family fructose-bisphosphate aldolase class Ia